MKTLTGQQFTFIPGIGKLGQNCVCEGWVSLHNGQPFDKTASHRAMMNSFLADGGDNFSVFERGTGQLGGDVDQMESYFATRSAALPGARDRIQQVLSCN